MDYDEAKRAAEAWLSQLAASPVKTMRRGTVRAALEAYLAHLRQQGRGNTALRLGAATRPSYGLTRWQGHHSKA